MPKTSRSRSSCLPPTPTRPELLLAFILFLLTIHPPASHAAERGFTTLFDGKSLAGWHTAWGVPYTAHDGVLTCPMGGGNLYTEKQYSDFVFRFQFKLTDQANNGVGIRAPFQGDAAYVGMEIQIIDDHHPDPPNLMPWQHHGAIYGVVAPKVGFLKTTGDWNSEEISAIARHIRVTLNGHVIVNADLDAVKDPAVLQQHPGLQRVFGHIGFLGHSSVVYFRNIRVKDLSRPRPDNTPPPGYRALFDGRDLIGWAGYIGSPPDRMKLSPEARKRVQAEADQRAFQHWRVVDGVITYDGKDDNLTTNRDYRNFALLVDWKIGHGGDSGIYLRGSPQVQIWAPDAAGNPNREGSGGLYNNEKNPSHPLLYADNPVGDWNHYLIVMVGDKVTVYLNGQLVTDRVTLENYWNRSLPIYPEGTIELQHHGSPLYFKNIYIRELR